MLANQTHPQLQDVCLCCTLCLKQSPPKIPHGLPHQSFRSYPNVTFSERPHDLFFYLFFILSFLFFFNFTILYWFCHISTWIRHRYTRVPHPGPSSLPVPSLWVVPVHQPQAGDSFHIWYYTCFNTILPNHPTLSLSHRVQKTVLYISVSFAETTWFKNCSLPPPFVNFNTFPTVHITIFFLSSLFITIFFFLSNLSNLPKRMQALHRPGTFATAVRAEPSAVNAQCDEGSESSARLQDALGTGDALHHPTQHYVQSLLSLPSGTDPSQRHLYTFVISFNLLGTPSISNWTFNLNA